MTFGNKYSTFWHQSPTSVYAIDWACCIACFAYLCLRDLSQSGPFAERGGDQEGHQALGRSRSKLTLRGHVVVKKIQLPTWVKGILRRHAKSIYTIYDITWNKCESSSWFFWTPFLPCTMEATLMWHEFYGGARRGWYRSVRVTWQKNYTFCIILSPSLFWSYGNSVITCRCRQLDVFLLMLWVSRNLESDRFSDASHRVSDSEAERQWFHLAK